jgi:hypothetical protein
MRCLRARLAPRLTAVVTKKQRRKQVARASALRRQDREHERAARRRLLQMVAVGLAVAAAVVALVFWIAVHDADSGATDAAPGGYDAASVDRTQPLNIEVPR